MADDNVMFGIGCYAQSQERLPFLPKVQSGTTRLASDGHSKFIQHARSDDANLVLSIDEMNTTTSISSSTLVHAVPRLILD